MAAYDWYECISGDEIQQGDIIDRCPVFDPGPDFSSANPIFRERERDLIVISQSCDLAIQKDGTTRLDQVVLCAMWYPSQFKPRSPTERKPDLKSILAGHRVDVHLIAPCKIPGFERELRLVDFRYVHSLPIEYIRNRLRAVAHLRLLPPYREQMAQAFARFFMRVGAPDTITLE